MTTTKSKPLATAKEKTTPPKPNDHGLSYKKLIQIHRDTRESGWSWATAAAIKDRYSISGQTLAMMHQRYGLPQLVADSHSKPAYSLPALEAVLESVPDKQATEEQPVKQPSDPQADLQRSREMLASARRVCESITNPWKQYRKLQASGDPTAAGVYYRKNKAAIAACRTNQ